MQPRRALDPGAQQDIQPDTEPEDERHDEPHDERYVEGHDDVSAPPRSPSTPVRLRDRLPVGSRRSRPGDEERSGRDGRRDWSWDLPPTPATERPQWPTTSPSRDSEPEPGDAQESDRPAEPAEPAESGESDDSERKHGGSQQRPNGPDAWLTAPQPAAGFSEHPTELLPTVPDTEDVPGRPDPATRLDPAAGPAPAGAVPEFAAEAGPADRGAPSNAEPAARQESGQPGRNRTGKQPGGKGGKADPAPKGRQRFKLLQSVGPRTPRPDVPDQSGLPADQRTDLAVRVTDLSITYRTSFEKKPTLRQAVVRLGRGQRAVREIKALQNISFEVRTGRSVGIIGRNGAGKSTLMRAMSGILPPTSGTVEVWGRASTLLALGIGFNNSLSGRENIILGGLASGLSLDEVAERANEIAEWTELGDFIDMPMRTYSSGMAGRVAFAVAVHMDPDILMIDEGLSTGDAHFKDKASAKMAELRDRARAMFLVSHGLSSIKELCDEAIWIDKGHLMARGEPEEVVDKYLHHLKVRRQSTSFEDV